ncbi:MAG: alkaline phosphatase D family protein [Pseudomonadota bacterium]
MDRRDFLITSLLGLGSGAHANQQTPAIELTDNPFTLGIASGDPTDTSIVLWTRLAPNPDAARGDMPDTPVPVRWALASAADMSATVATGTAMAVPTLAHSVHVDIDGLQPDRHYWYQFSVGGYTSAIGRTRTLPRRGSQPASQRFVTTSCQNYTHGYFVAYQHMLHDQPQFIVHLGDYLYDTSFGEDFRQHETTAAPVTLDAFRRRHALYKTDVDLQRAHAQIPFFTVIDNHDAIDDNDPARRAQRTAAYQAWYEHMPVRGYHSIGASHFDLHRCIHLGQLAQISLLDPRQFRDQKTPCANAYPDYGFGNYRERCTHALDPQRSMLGAQQQAWLDDVLANNTAVWNVLASPGPLLPFSYRHEGHDLRYIGAWDSYPANRERVANALTAAPGHPLVLSGDVHSFWALDGRAVPDASERFELVEFITSSVSANWPALLSEPVQRNLPHNPHVTFYRGDKRGYLLHDVTEDAWTTTMCATSDARDSNAVVERLARFTVDVGKPGLRSNG